MNESGGNDQALSETWGRSDGHRTDREAVNEAPSIVGNVDDWSASGAGVDSNRLKSAGKSRKGVLSSSLKPGDGVVP